MRGAWATLRDRTPSRTLPAGGYLRHIIGVNFFVVKLIELPNLIENNYRQGDLTRIAVKPTWNLDEKKPAPGGRLFMARAGISGWPRLPSCAAWRG